MTLSSRLRRWTRRKGARAVDTVEPANAQEIAVPEFPTETLWHYTNTAGLLGILNNVDKKAEDDKPRSGTYKPILHASAAQFLNDRRELTLGLDLIKDGLVALGVRGSFDPTPEAKAFLQEVARAIQQVVDQTYPDFIHCSIVSFSTQCDSLSQWRAYGQGTGGFAIGFEPELFPRNSTLERIGGLGLQKVTYVTDTLEGQLLDAFHLFIAQAQTDIRSGKPNEYAVRKAVQRLALRAASVKHAGFDEEREWRYVEPGFGQQLGVPNDPDFKAGAAGLVPHRRIELPAEAVVGLWVGSGPYQYENYLAAQSMLYRYGYVAASHNVHRSDTPFR
ncbi:hypothetical protein CH306_26375 [Rhodococcus sp. 15-725-2-2b]|nr:hypothetical protein CH277_22285 [Rhodococcus sp. 06-469-3-2]OZD40754.1 hypothetical protein CH264_23970 [Rhodococcus sp. 06-1477-1A]OZE67138.1 hypothetical protein CH306_26375 [Rhodococcus sp. 15-725-2-2b]